MQRVKPNVQELTQSKDIITLSFDDSIQEKLYTDDSELNCWHYDHNFGRSVKGVNFLIVLVEVGTMKLPVGVKFVMKDSWEADSKTGKKSAKQALQKMNFSEKCSKNAMVNFILIMF
jgi:hypothetical protein|nr:hypothetical protein [uncultured Flavobacterium sp.]